MAEEFVPYIPPEKIIPELTLKMVVVGMTSSEFTIADPDDAGMLDVVGFDASAPRVISDFSKGTV